jgi:hypothetical protein
MKLKIFVKKVNLNAFADNRYWGSFDKFIDLSLNDDQFLKLLNFYQSVTDYRNYIQSYLTPSDGTAYKFVSSESNPFVGYYIFGLAGLEHIPAIRDNDYYRAYIEKRDELFTEIGWVQEEEKMFEINSDYDDINLTWSNIPSDFDTVANLYQQESL